MFREGEQAMGLHDVLHARSQEVGVQPQADREHLQGKRFSRQRVSLLCVAASDQGFWFP
jgi:hypothetical protein